MHSSCAWKGRKDFPRIRLSYNFIWRLEGWAGRAFFKPAPTGILRDLSRLATTEVEISDWKLSVIDIVRDRDTPDKNCPHGNKFFETWGFWEGSSFNSPKGTRKRTTVRKTTRLPHPCFLSPSSILPPPPFARIDTVLSATFLSIFRPLNAAAPSQPLSQLSFFVPVYAGYDTHANSIPFWNLAGDTTYSHRKWSLLLPLRSDFLRFPLFFCFISFIEKDTRYRIVVSMLVLKEQAFYFYRKIVWWGIMNKF